VSDLSPEVRHRARELALQWLYQWEVGGLDLDEVFDAGRQVQLRPPDESRDRLAESLVRGTADHLAEIDPIVADTTAHWRLERLAVIDRLILRLAVYELLFSPETPHAVVINEALELARTFSTEEAVKFVNGVLDGVRKKLATRSSSLGAGE
jgi:transcription antitermination protein NusB